MKNKREKSSNRSTIVRENERNTELDHNMFRIRTNMAACEKRLMPISVLGTVCLQALKYIILKTRSMESGQTYFEPFMDSEWL